MLKVYFTLSVGNKFSRVITIEALPSVGSLLKVANHSFVVKEHEQDLDAYEERAHENGFFCNSIKAEVNDKFYGDIKYYKEICTDLIKAGWKKIEDY